MGKIVAIGGGEIGRPGFEIETEVIDKEIIKLSGKKNPKLLFIPTASGDSLGYVDVVNNYFGKRLGCHIEVLYLVENDISLDEIREKIFGSDIIYVGGGNTKKMLDIWREKNIEKILKEAFEKGIVLSGVSAGAICWFEYGCSDSVNYKLDSEPESFVEIKGLGFVKGLFCPHYDVETNRKKGLKNMMKDNGDFAYALDNCCAIKIVDGNFEIIKSKNSANAYKVYWENNECYEEIID